jgi:hypothetical protein
LAGRLLAISDRLSPKKHPLPRNAKFASIFSATGHRPPFFRHWKGMIFEIANDCA